MTLREMINRKVRGAQERKERRQAKARLLWCGKPGNKSLEASKSAQICPRTCDSGYKRATLRKRLVARLDAIFSLYIRQRDRRRFGRCPFHAELVPATQCFHFLSRTKYATRWNEYNAVASCGGCNIRYEHDVIFIHKVKEWYMQNYGPQTWDLIEVAGHRKTPMSDSEMVAINQNLKIKLGSII